jgi:NAD-dependent SIR2 family protein deacetylase
MDLIDRLRDEIKNKKNIIFMVGAGISTTAGIPDFRSKNGIYEKINKKYPQFKDPSDIFNINFVNDNVDIFFEVIGDIINCESIPTLAHIFMKEINDTGKLKRIYTQNIDGLEIKAGIPSDKIIQVHGNMDKWYCNKCKHEYTIKESLEYKICQECIEKDKKNIIRPDIVFFGETVKLSNTFARKDFSKCDLLIIMGTSMSVYPFADLPKKMPRIIPIYSINNTRINIINEINPYRETHFADYYEPKKRKSRIINQIINDIDTVVKLLI